MFHVAEMRVFDARIRVHVVNLSISGLMLRSDAPPAPGTTAIFDLGVAERRGRVVWSDHDRCGVQFLVPLTEAELEALTTPIPVRPAPVQPRAKRVARRSIRSAA